MEWFETEARKQVADTAGRFAENELLKRNWDLDEQGKQGLLQEVMQQAWATGFLTSSLPELLGGSALDTLSETILWETLAGGCAGVAAILAIHAAGLHVLADLQSVPSVVSWLRNEFLEARAGLPRLAGLAIPEAIVDHTRPVTSSLQDRKGDQITAIEGTFLCLLSPPAASRVIILTPAHGNDARLLWLEPGKAESLCVQSYPGSGLEELPKGRLVCVPHTPVHGEILCTGEEAFLMGRKLLTSLRLALAAMQIGNADAAWKMASRYATERVQTGRAIIEHQEVRKMLVHMETLIQAGRSLLYRAAACTGEPSGQKELAGMADTFCAHMAELVCLDAIQVLGGYGYMKDYGLEKRLRDCKTMQALLGSYAVDWLGDDGFIRP